MVHSRSIGAIAHVSDGFDTETALNATSEVYRLVDHARLKDTCCPAGFKDVPVGEKEPLVGKVFQNVAPKYDVMNDVMSVGMHRLWKDQLVSKLSPAPGIQHLDVAGGTGDVAFRILSNLKQHGAFEGAVNILDINEAMINEGKKKAETRKLAGEASARSLCPQCGAQTCNNSARFATLCVLSGICT